MIRAFLSRSAWACGALSVLLAGCFKSVDVDKIYCATDDNCPSGYFCADSTKPGGCRPKGTQADASAGDAVSLQDGDASNADGADVADALPFTDAGEDRSPSLDGTVPVDTAPTDTKVPEPPVDAYVPPVDAYVPPVDATVVDTNRDVPVVFVDAAPDVPVTIDTRGKGPGEHCSSGTECASTYCVDEVCCNDACSGQCQSCAEANKVGTCTTVAGAPRGHRTACGGTGPCAGQCGGSLPDHCTFPGAEATCGSAACNDEASLKLAPTCNGAGACGTPQVSPCGAGKYCSGNACLAQAGNGGACTTSGQCSSGNCTNNLCCAANRTACASTCVDLMASNSNCGSCGVPCGTGTTCTMGNCLLLDGQPCAKGASCASGVCSTFLYDGDKDGYGVVAGTFKMCGTNPPVGYANKAGDCCEGNPDIHPGQTAYFTTPADCNGSPTWDYDCSGSNEKREEADVDTVCTNVAGSGCTQVAASGTPTEECGTSYLIPFLGSCAPKAGFCMFLAGTKEGGTVACH